MNAKQVAKAIISLLQTQNGVDVMERINYLMSNFDASSPDYKEEIEWLEQELADELKEHLD